MSKAHFSAHSTPRLSFFRFTRIPFGLTSATEVFQKKNEAAYAGIEGIHIVADVIIIVADTIEEHDVIYRKFCREPENET